MTFPPLTHVALTVADLPASVAWYADLFGAPPIVDDDHGTYDYAVWLQPNFGLHRHHGDRPTDRFDEHRVGLDHVAFGCRSRDELVAWEARLDDLGVAHGDILDLPYGSGLSFRDPDGIALEFFASARRSPKTA